MSIFEQFESVRHCDARRDDLILRNIRSHEMLPQLHCDDLGAIELVDLPEVSVNDTAEVVMDCTRLEAALDAIANAHNPDELLKAMNELREIYGLAHLAYAGLRMPDLADADPYFVLTYPDEWVERYRREELFRIDPVYVASRTRFLPFDWRTLDLQSPDARYIFSEAARYGVGTVGMSFPMRGPDGDAGAFSFTANLELEDWTAFKNRNQFRNRVRRTLFS